MRKKNLKRELWFIVLLIFSLSVIIFTNKTIIYLISDIKEITNIAPKEEYNGYLCIPKIKLKKGFYDIHSIHNKVSEGLEVINPSQMPNVKKGNLIIASHSGNSPISYFRDLDKLDLEDKLNIEYKHELYKYAIKRIYKVEKNGSVEIIRDKNKSCLTLITCDKNDKTKQIVIIGELIN